MTVERSLSDTYRKLCETYHMSEEQRKEFWYDIASHIELVIRALDGVPENDITAKLMQETMNRLEIPSLDSLAQKYR